MYLRRIVPSLQREVCLDDDVPEFYNVLFAGVDCKLNLWSVVDNTSSSSSDVVSKKSSSAGKGGKKKSGSSGPKVEFAARIEKVRSVYHGSKINALVSDNVTIQNRTTDGEDASSSRSDVGKVAISGRLFVADMTSDISVYELASTLENSAVIS